MRTLTLTRDHVERVYKKVDEGRGARSSATHRCRVQRPKGISKKPAAQSLEPGIMATIPHSRGEEALRHASVQKVND